VEYTVNALIMADKQGVDLDFKRARLSIWPGAMSSKRLVCDRTVITAAVLCIVSWQ
jgi:hypothetical protein